MGVGRDTGFLEEAAVLIEQAKRKINEARLEILKSDIIKLVEEKLFACTQSLPKNYSLGETKGNSTLQRPLGISFPGGFFA